MASAGVAVAWYNGPMLLSPLDMEEILRLVRKIASEKQVAVPNGDADELYSVGLVAVAEALRDFDSSRGSLRARVYTFVRLRIIDHLRTLSIETRDGRRSAVGSGPSGVSEQYAGSFGLPKFSTLMAYLPLDSPMPQKGFSKPSGHIGDLFGSSRDIQKVDAKILVEGLLSGLNERSRKIIKMHFLDGMTMALIGTTLGLSQPTIWQVIEKSKAKMFETLTGGSTGNGLRNLHN